MVGDGLFEFIDGFIHVEHEVGVEVLRHGGMEKVIDFFSGVEWWG